MGAGIQGLWLLADLTDAGYQAILLERMRPGFGQTGHSHVFLHEGHMFASMVKRPQDEIVHRIESVWEANRLWKEALGIGRLNNMVPLSNNFYIGWNNQNKANIFQTICNLAKLPYQPVTSPSEFGAIQGVERFFQSECICLESKALLDSFLNYRDLKKRVGYCEDISLETSLPGSLQLSVRRDRDATLQIRTSALILTAGAGNEQMASRFFSNSTVTPHQPKPKQQSVKTYMLVVKHLKASLAPVAGMFPDFGGLFMVSRRDPQGRTVWLIGNGDRKLVSCAGEMTAFDAAAWFQKLKMDLTKLLPDVIHNANDYAWGIYEASKAEPWTKSNNHPDGGEFPTSYGIYKDSTAPIWLAWPSLLTFTPIVALSIIDDLKLTVAPGAVTGDWRLWESFRAGLASSNCRWKTTPLQNWTEFTRCFSPPY